MPSSTKYYDGIAKFWLFIDMAFIVTSLFWPTIGNLLFAPILGIVNLIVGVFGVIRYMRGRRESQILPFLFLLIVGLIMTVGPYLFLYLLSTADLGVLMLRT
jgi:hypothetical protein